MATTSEPPPSTDAAPFEDLEHGGTVDPRRLAQGRRRSVLGLAVAGVLVVAAVAALVSAVVLPRSESSGESSKGSGASTGSNANAVAAVDSSTGRPAGSIPLAASPTAVEYGEGSVWVAVTNQDAVTRIDPKTNTVQQTISVETGPTGIAGGDGFVWVANSLDGTVSQIDPRTNGGRVVDKISVGNGPTGIAYGLGGVWVANSLDHTVVRIDPLTDKPGEPISIDAGADAIAVGDGAVWVTSKSARVLSRVDPQSGSVTPINVGRGSSAVATGTGAVWVANSQDGTVWRIDPETNRVVGTVTVGEGPSGVAVAPGGSVWVSNDLSGTLSKIDPASGKVAKSVPVGERPQGVAVSANTAYAAVRGSGLAHRGGTLTVAVANPPNVYQGGIAKGLDPASRYGEAALLTLTNDGLLGYGRSGGAEGYRVVPDLAVALPTITDGGRTYAFQLRPGIDYSTGGVVQPADIRRGIERALLKSNGATPGSYLSGIVGADRCLKPPKRCDLSKGIATDRHANAVTFHLAAPDPDFLYKLALPLADAVRAGTPLEAAVPLPATGPYEIARFDAKKGVIRLVRNPRFHLWSTAAQPDGFPDQIVEKYGYTARAPSAPSSVGLPTSPMTVRIRHGPGHWHRRCGGATRAASTPPPNPPRPPSG